MFKLVKIIIGSVAALSLAGVVYAAGISVKIETPKSPSNQTNVKINVVVLDTAASNPITVKCFKVGSPDTQFGSDIAVAAGGNSVNCETNGSVITGEGTYQFYATATNGTETVTSETVSIHYDLNGPEAPTSYSKEPVDSCTWKISFHTANDGKTAKVEIYRSEDSSFSVDSGNRIGTVSVGPNTDGSFTTGKPDCSKNYYYAIRAFDSIGNGSGVVGDSETHTVTTTVVSSSGASGTSGAIAGGNQGNVLGGINGASEGATGASGTILGEEASESATPTPTVYNPPAPLSKKPFVAGIIAIVVVGLLVWFVKRKNA